MLGHRFATGINSLASNPQDYWPNLTGKPSLAQMVARAATVERLTELDLNCPDHVGADASAIGRVVRDTGLSVIGLAMRYCNNPAHKRGACTNPDPAVRLETIDLTTLIAKSLRANARIIAMDEPTSSLTPAQFERLVAVIGRLLAQDVSIIYVSHKMAEVFCVCQTATILRDGRLITQVPIPATPVSQVIELMVGRELASPRTIPLPRRKQS